MQYLYTLKTRYDVVHVDLGPVFMTTRQHLELLWRELLETCATRTSATGTVQVIVERRTRLRDLRANEDGEAGDFLCGVEAEGLRVVFCLYGEGGADTRAEFAALTQSIACALRLFPTVENALRWAGMDEGETPVETVGQSASPPRPRAARDTRSDDATLGFNKPPAYA